MLQFKKKNQLRTAISRKKTIYVEVCIIMAAFAATRGQNKFPNAGLIVLFFFITTVRVIRIL